MLPLDAGTGRPCPLEPSPAAAGAPAIGPFLRRHAATRRWTPTVSPAGAPGFLIPGGGGISFEPGGQLELSTRPHDSIDALLAEVESVLVPLAREAEDAGIRLLARGMDPVTPVDETRLQLCGDRYRRMTEHYDRSGPAGRRMMRQTAAIHLNLDLGTRPLERWAVANALAPVLVAAFANSSRAEGRPAGHRSVRAAQWRQLDPTRTGVVDGEGSPEDAYLRFALGAEAFLLGPDGEPARPFRDWLDRGAGPEAWRRHLTTLFPEVRPRGYLELRSVDALPLRWYGVPLALAVGILYDDRALLDARDALPPADPRILERAGRKGLADPEVARRTALAFELADDGLRRDVRGCGAGGRELLGAFRAELTRSGLDPAGAGGDDLLDGHQPR